MKKNHKVFVSITVAGTITVDAEDGINAMNIVEDMDGAEVLANMIRDEIDICADDAEENEGE